MLPALVQAGGNYAKSVHAGTACNTKRARGCQADFGGEGMYRRGENHDKRGATATELPFPNLLLRSEAEIKERSFNIMDTCKNDSRHTMTVRDVHFDEFSSLTQNLHERFHEQGIHLGRLCKQ